MHGRLAQLVEHSLDVRRVSSSSLLTSTTVKEIGFCQSLFLFPRQRKAAGFCRRLLFYGSVQIHHFGADALHGVEGFHHPVNGFPVAAGLKHDDAVIRAEFLAGFVQPYPQTNIASEFRQGFLQIQGIASPVVYPKADDIVAIHDKTSFLFLFFVCAPLHHGNRGVFGTYSIP